MTSAELLRKAADALDEGVIPLMNPFLSEQTVTASLGWPPQSSTRQSPRCGLLTLPS